MKWTKERPKKEGWYWFKAKNKRAVIVELKTIDSIMSWYRNGHAFVVELSDGEWAGPIKEPAREIPSKRLPIDWYAPTAEELTHEGHPYFEEYIQTFSTAMRKKCFNHEFMTFVQVRERGEMAKHIMGVLGKGST